MVVLHATLNILAESSVDIRHYSSTQILEAQIQFLAQVIQSRTRCLMLTVIHQVGSCHVLQYFGNIFTDWSL